MHSETHKKLSVDGHPVPTYMPPAKTPRTKSDVKKTIAKKAKMSFCMSLENMQNFIEEIKKTNINNKVFMNAIKKCQNKIQEIEVDMESEGSQGSQGSETTEST